MTVRAILWRDIQTNSHKLFVEHDRRGTAVLLGDRLEWREANPGDTRLPILTIEGDHDQGILRAIANALAVAGIIADQTDTRRELAATKAHLEDMRGMAIKAFDAQLKASQKFFYVDGSVTRIQDA